MPNDTEKVISAVEMAFLQLASQATALKLLTVDNASQVIRQGYGGTYVRMPNLPSTDEDEMDIDNELVPALARIIASYISRERSEYHSFEALKIIRAYESKVRVFISSREAKGDYSLSQTDGCSTSEGVCDVK